MKAKTFLFLPAFFVCAAASAQTNAPATKPVDPDNPPYVPPPSVPKPHVSPVQQPDQVAPQAASPGNSEADPAKVADFQERFKQGNALEADGKLAEARQVYEGILAEDANARGSLLAAGKISFRLGELAKADDYLSRLHKLEPTFPAAIELLIQINQALKHDVKVELLVRDFRTLHDSGKIPALAGSLCFVRERLSLDKQQVMVSQFFDYTKAPNTVWMAEVFDGDGNLQRRILLNYDPSATEALRKKDPKYGNTEVFTWFEHVLDHGQVKAINAYLQIFALPDYAKFRSAMLVIMAAPPKPLYSAPVNP